MEYNEFTNLHLSADKKQLRKQRDIIIIKLRKDGVTLSEIGKRVDLSREGVRRVLNNNR